MLVLSGDHVAFDTRAPGGTWIGFFEPSAAEMIWRPALLRIVSERARFALKSTKTPPSSWNGFENVFIGTGPSPISSRNHFLSGLALVSETFRYRVAVTASASSFAGV